MLSSFEVALGIIGVLITLEACRRSVGVPDRDRFFLLPALWTDTEESADDESTTYFIRQKVLSVLRSEHVPLSSYCLSCSEAS